VRRREFIGLVGGAAVAWPLAARGQEPGRLYRLGGLHLAPRQAPHHVALFDELRRQGFIEGQNLAADWRGHGSSFDQFPSIAVEFANLKVDVILCAGDVAIRAAQQATTAIPILGITDDMVRSGLVRSLATPGGNTTGVSLLAPELDGRRQDLLMELLPGARRMAALADPNTTMPHQMLALQNEVRARGVELEIHRAEHLEDVVPAIHAAKASGALALNVLASPLFFNNRQIVIERITSLRLPAVYQWPEMARDGGLISYGPSIVQIYREHMARLLVFLLRGAKPTDLPVEQPTKFELVINLKTAKALGVTIPPLLLARADEVIE
jgi:ABC-type uncharacterized transport system substrate-binding protein